MTRPLSAAVLLSLFFPPGAALAMGPDSCFRFAEGGTLVWSAQGGGGGDLPTWIWYPIAAGLAGGGGGGMPTADAYAQTPFFRIGSLAGGGGGGDIPTWIWYPIAAGVAGGGGTGDMLTEGQYHHVALIRNTGVYGGNVDGQVIRIRDRGVAMDGPPDSRTITFRATNPADPKEPPLAERQWALQPPPPGPGMYPFQGCFVICE